MRDDMLAALAGRLRRHDSEQRLKRRLYFKSTSLDLYLQMALSYGSFGGSSVGEALYASSQVRERDLDTWITAWRTVGESASRYAAEAEARGARRQRAPELAALVHLPAHRHPRGPPRRSALPTPLGTRPRARSSTPPACSTHR